MNKHRLSPYNAYYKSRIYVIYMNVWQIRTVNYKNSQLYLFYSAPDTFMLSTVEMPQNPLRGLKNVTPESSSTLSAKFPHRFISE